MAHSIWTLITLCLLTVGRLANTQDSIALDCQEGWTLYEGTCLKLFTVKMEWSDASAVCESYGAHLVNIFGFQENMEVSKFVQETSDIEAFWIGELSGQKRGVEGYWAGAEPEDGRDCAYLMYDDRQFYKHAWNKARCSSAFPFLCEASPILNGMVSCLNGKFIKPADVCDGKNGCGNNWDERDCPSTCNKYYKRDDGIIETDNPYDLNEDCQWTIEASPGKRVILKFSTVKTEENIDVIEVWAGGPTKDKSHLKMRVSGTKNAGDIPDIYSNNNFLLLTFQSDSSASMRGFSASYFTEDIMQSEPDLNQATETYQSIQSLMYPDRVLPSQRHTFNIFGPLQRSVISLQIIELDVDPESYLQVFDGEDKEAPILATIKGSDIVKPQVIISTTNNMTIYYHTSDKDYPGKGFKATYINGCKGTITSDSGEIISPGYNAGRHYPNSQTCEWTVSSLTANIPMNFIVDEDFELSGTLGLDTLTVYRGTSDQDPMIAEHAGEGMITPSSFLVSGGEAFFRFKSTSVNSATGFKISFSKNCPDLVFPENSIITPTSFTTTLGSKINVRCESGNFFAQEVHLNKESVDMECLPGGWNVDAVPICEPVYCGQPPQVENAHIIESDGVQFEDVVTYECDAGFDFIAAGTVECTQSNEWSEPYPVCRPASCITPSAPSNGDMELTEGTGTEYGSIYEFSCDDGFQISGSPAIICEGDGDWSDDVPTCERLTCPLPMIPNSDEISPEVVVFQSSTSVSCKSGYSLTGSSLMRCQADRTFDAVPSCDDVNECTTNPCEGTCTNTDGSFECTCDEGYTLADNDRDCDDINECLTENGGCSDDCGNIDGSYVCSCPTGYTLFKGDGSEGYSLSDKEDGTRRGDVLHIDHTCVRKQCVMDPATLENGNILSNQETFHYEDEVYFYCNLGFEITDTTPLVCQADGTFIPANPPTCEPATCPLPSTAGMNFPPSSFDPSSGTIAYGESVTMTCEQHLPEPVELVRECVYDQRNNVYTVELDDALDCPVIDCGDPDEVLSLVPASEIATRPSNNYLNAQMTLRCGPSSTVIDTTGNDEGDDVVVCREDGNWDFGAFTCSSKSCGDPGTPPLARQIHDGLYQQGQQVTFECIRDGYTLQPDLPLTCVLKDGADDPEWDGDLPECVDTEPPVIQQAQNLCGATKTIGKMSAPRNNGGFDDPTATDNTGATGREMGITVSPQYFTPDALLNRNLNVIYTVEDAAGNVATCEIEIKLRDESLPVLTCPDSYTYKLTSRDTVTLQFPQAGHEATATDNEDGDVTITYIQSQITVDSTKVGELYQVDVTAEDVSGNVVKCAYSVHIEAGECQDWDLYTPINGNKDCTETDNNGWKCTITCNENAFFYDDPATSELTYSCNPGQAWTPSTRPPDCVVMEASEYTVAYSVIYTHEAFEDEVNDIPTCLSHYTEELKKILPAIASKYISLCRTFLEDNSANIVPNYDDDYLKVIFSTGLQATAIMSFSLFPQDMSSDRLKSGCGGLILAGLRTGNAFESGQDFLPASDDGKCVRLDRKVDSTSAEVKYEEELVGRVCSEGHKKVLVANVGEACFPCPYGHFYNKDEPASSAAFCQECPQGEYQDTIPSTECKPCTGDTYTHETGSPTADFCIDTCATIGMISDNLVPPCRQCAEGSYASDATTCTTCDTGKSTVGIGADSEAQCDAFCEPGTYSDTGLEPCLECPPNFYQNQERQTTCIACSGTLVTATSGSDAPSDCINGADVVCVDNGDCGDHGTCSVQFNQETCTCDDGWTGRRCDIQINFCKSSPCVSGTCVPKENGYDCNCPSTDFSGRHCEIDPPDCEGHECQQGVCQDQVDSYVCLCPDNFGGTFCQITADICGVNQCKNGGKCVKVSPSIRECECEDGFTGRDCSINIDECASNPCLYGAPCEDLDNGYQCRCPTGYGGRNCESIPLLPCLGSPCGSSADCIPDYRTNGIMCLCRQGYDADQTKAEEEDLWNKHIDTITVDGSCRLHDYCDPEDPCERGTCASSTQGHNCVCPTGYDGVNCQHDADNCADDPCGENGVCKDEFNGYKCECNPGFKGPTCTSEINECQEPSYPCDNEGVDDTKGRYSGCDDLANGYKCHCKDGYTGGPDGDDCSVNIDECASDPCMHGSECKDVANGFTCECTEGWTGPTCNVKEDYCDPGPCQNGAECLNVFAKPFCKCSGLFYGPECEQQSSVCENPNPCIDPNARCMEASPGVADCECSEQYTGTGCEIQIDFCQQEGLCQHEGICIPELDGFTCKCLHDFRGERCQESVDNCKGVTCPNGGKCIDGIDGHFCNCPDGRTGPLCNKGIDSNYDISFFSEDKTSTACLQYPFELDVDELSIGMWVRFNEKGGEGTFFTLYGMDQPYNGGDIVELVSFDHAKVYSTFGSISEAREYNFYDINDSQWYHIVLTWKSETGTVNVMVNSVKVIDIPSGHGTDWKTPKFGMIVLGAQIDSKWDPIPGSSFNGVIHGVHAWDRCLSFLTEIHIMSDDAKALVTDDLILRWINYQTKFGAKITRPSKANTVVCLDPQYGGPNCDILLPDKTPPKILNCPDTIWKYNSERLTQVEWEEIQAEGIDGSGLRSIYLNERVYVWGKYKNIYAAYDNAGNAAMCSFDIFVRKHNCEDPVPAPINGKSDCSNDVYPFKNCFVSCDAGNAFALPTPDFFTCGPQGSFNPLNYNLDFKYPACSASKRARVDVRVFLTYEGIAACEEVLKVDGFGIPILKEIEELNKLWGEEPGLEDGFCHGETCSDVVTVTSECAGQPTVGRKRRSILPMFILIILRGIREYLYNKDGVMQTPAEILTAYALDNNGFDESDTIPNALPDEESIRVVMSPICEEGQTIDETGLECVDCAPGTYYDSNTESCLPCEIAYYQDEVKATSCKYCGSGKTTELTGSTSSSDCYRICGLGEFLNTGTGQCEWCPIGFYQDNPGQFYCKPCDADKTTQDIQSTSVNQCLDVCPDGTELALGGSCTVCPRGTYRTQGAHPRCTECDPGLITPQDQSRTKDECTVPDCQPGSFHNVDTNLCEQCAVGFYQSQKWQESCIECDDRKTTLSEGSISVSQCLFYCPTGMEEFPEGSSTCRMCPIGSYKDNSQPGEVCVTCDDGGKPGYVTENIGSTSILNCTILGCAAGEQPNANEDGCDPCPLGTYQPSPYQPLCIPCDDDESTEEEGSQLSSDCKTFCQDGYFHNAFRVCTPCLRGSFRNNNDNKFGPCEMCPDTHITADEASTHPDDCNVRNCTSGYYLDANANTCVPCPMGEYQDEWWQEECKECPEQKTTEQIASESEDDCLLNCGPGFEDKDDQCQQCGIGYYKSTAGSTLCTKCREGFVTRDIGATSEGACDIGDCQPGSFRDTDDQCYECPKSTYQDKKWQPECIDCPLGTNNRMMTTAGNGADKREDCFLQCDSGYEYKDGRCQECPRGFYRTRNEHDFCEQCDIEFITPSSGSSSREQCIVANCSAGTYLSEDNECIECPYGQYQAQVWQANCLSCPFSMTTLERGSTSSGDCRRSCPSGQELVQTTNQCRPCPQNMFRDMASSFTCVPCPPGTISPSVGATSADQCTWPDCQDGFFISDGNCEPCPDGKYQPNVWKTDCVPCPQGSKATTGGTGATAVTQCETTDDCLLNENLCSGMGEICVDLPGLDQYECQCGGKYTEANGVTPPCVHKCDTGYCLNNATCDRESADLCKCVNGWRGERCDEEPPSMTPYIIGGAVGGFVFLILLTLLICVCCACLSPKAAPAPAPMVSKAPVMMPMMNTLPAGVVARPATRYAGSNLGSTVIYQTGPPPQPSILQADTQSLPGYSQLGQQPQYMFYEERDDYAPSQLPTMQQYGTVNSGFEEKVSQMQFA